MSLSVATGAAAATGTGADRAAQGGTDGESFLPQTLSGFDAAHYAAAFALQEEHDWVAADAHLAQVKDRVLIGTVMAQRYLSPAYHTSFTEARHWLTLYPTLPEAHAIWLLARHKAPRHAAVPVPASVSSPDARAGSAHLEDAAPLPPEPAMTRSAPPGGFEAGIVAWRGHRYGEALRRFAAVARSSQVDPWYVAAGAFWAARAEMVMGRMDQVDPWLAVAAAQPRSFYGLLGRRTLGLDLGIPVGPQRLSDSELSLLRSLPGGRRALALLQIGEADRAEQELHLLNTRSTKGLANAVVALADLAHMPSLCLALGSSVTSARRQVEAAYPMPHWQPRNGYSVDRALMFALMMEESNFDTEAESGSGAQGLMQLMPQTARAVARRAGIPLRHVSDLVDPVLNLSLGQEYVKQLMAHAEINGNLILMLAAYNSGTAALDRWQARPEYRQDPLLFIESLPKAETRLYVERVLTNMWVYRNRLDQAVPDLDALAANEWPRYVAVDTTEVASNQN